MKTKAPRLYFQRLPGGFTFRCGHLFMTKHRDITLLVGWRGHLILERPISAYYKTKTWLRKQFPYFYALGLRDCDSGGRVHCWLPVFAWNYRHLGKLMAYYNGWGDGEVWSQTTMIRWIKWRLEERKRD